MAPICADPRQIVITFEPDQRQALLKLVDEITQYMIFQLESPSGDLGPVELEGRDSYDSDLKDDMAGLREELAVIDPAPDDTSSATKKTAEEQEKPLSKQALKIQEAARDQMYEWKDEFILKLAEIVCVQDDQKIIGERKKRLQALSKSGPDDAALDDQIFGADELTINPSDDRTSLQKLYKPIPTKLLKSVSAQDRREALSCVLLLQLATGKYSAHSRALALYLASSLGLTQAFVNHEEIEIARSLMEASATDEGGKQEAMSAEAETAKRQEQNKFSRFWKVGLASVAGAAIVGVTGGLAAPLVAGALGGILGGVGLGGVASFLGVFWMNGALVGALFGAYGAKMTGSLMDSYAKEIEDFKFIPLREPEEASRFKKSSNQNPDRRLRLTIGINGWLNDEEDVIKPWKVLGPETEVFALRYEMKTLLSLGTALTDLVQSFSWNVLKSEVIKRTVLATLWAALWPIQILKIASNVDNPFSRASDRSAKAGQLLADALINKVQGERPVTLIGYSLGATAIHACLQSLAERHAFGLIENVVIIGTPAPASPGHWRTLRTVVSGRIFNVFSENDMILGFVYRMHSLSLGVAGLQEIAGVQGVENLNLSDRVSGHLRYPSLTGGILRKCAFISAQGGDEIEKDDVIKMKDDYAQGNLIDFDGEDMKDDRADDGDAEVKMRDLKVSSTDFAQSDEPPLPRRPMGPATVKEKPVTSSESKRHSWNSQPSDNGSYKGVKMVDNDDRD